MEREERFPMRLIWLVLFALAFTIVSSVFA